MPDNTAANKVRGPAQAAAIATTPPAAPQRVALHNLHVLEAGTSRDSPTLKYSIPTETGHVEAHGEPKIPEFCAAQRRRCALIAGVGTSCVLVTGLALKVAGCTYAEIQWPITTILIITGMFLTPAYANSIA